MSAGKSRRLEWSVAAHTAYRESLERIADEDTLAAEQVRERVARALALIADFPGIGTPAIVPGYRRYPVAKTGHVLTYRPMRGRIVVVQWYRARRDIKPGF